MSTIPHEYVAYIDESGDDGLGKYRIPGQDGGSSHWFSVSACIVRRKNDRSLVASRDAILQMLKRHQLRDIHFAKFKHGQKRAIITEMVKLPIRVSSVLSCKQHIPAGSYQAKNSLHFYLTRYLLERISWLCQTEKKEMGKVRLVFSNRGGVSYDELRAYLKKLKSKKTTIDWRHIDPELVESRPHTALAGLQFADCAARGFAEAVEPNEYGDFILDYAELLRPVVYNYEGNYGGYGVKVLCKENLLDDRQKRLLRLYPK